MRLVKHTVRLPPEVDKAVLELAKAKGDTVYAMLATCIEAGVAALNAPPLNETASHELVTEMASVSTRLAEVARMLDRTLYIACTAYCYARSASQGAGKTDEVVLVEINRAYDRQIAIAREDRS